MMWIISLYFLQKLLNFLLCVCIYTFKQDLKARLIYLTFPLCTIIYWPIG